jgi:fatty-acyl-CoA synthase
MSLRESLGARESLREEVEARRAALDRRHAPWRPLTLSKMLQHLADAYPDRPFVIDQDTVHTYRATAEKARRFARGFLAAGVQPGDRVAIVLPNGFDFIAARFAVALVGAVAVPVSFRLRATELGEVLRQSRPAVLVAMESFRDVDALEALDRILPGWESTGGSGLTELRLVVTAPSDGAPQRRAHLPTLASLERGPDRGLDAELAARDERASPEDLATIFFTSGTTGRPKGVLSTHDMELRSAYGSAYTRGFEDGRRILFALPLNHVFAYIEGLLASMWVAGTVVVHPVFDPEATLRAVARHRVGEALFVPTMSLAVVEAARRSAFDLSSLHSVMSAAQSAPARLWTDLYEVLGVRQCVTAYGMSETSAATTFTEPGGPIEDLVGTVGRPKLGGIAGDPELGGRLAAYKTIDPGTLEDLPDGEEGELVARGPIVTAGYFDQPDATAEAALPGGWLRSGDLGYIRADGSLVLTGRSKDLYKCGGELVAPAEVERLITALPEVSQAYVVGVPDPRMGEVGCAWVVPAGTAEIDAQALIEHCRRELARFKVPAHVLVTTAADLPLTASGKVQKYLLAERATKELGLEP